MTRFHIFLIITITASIWSFGQDNDTVASKALASPSSTSASEPKNGPWFSQRHPRYRLQPGDIFDINFELTPEFNQTVTVQPDGYVTLRSVSDLYVVGLTVPELVEKLRAAYDTILTHPLISLLLKDVEKPYFLADGQVGHPGKYELRGDTTVVQAIAMAGGFSPSAKHSSVVLYHRVSDEWTEAKLIDVKKMQNTHNLSEDVHLRPGDMVFVPKNRISKIAPFIPTSNLSVVPRPF